MLQLAQVSKFISLKRDTSVSTRSGSSRSDCSVDSTCRPRVPPTNVKEFPLSESDYTPIKHLGNSADGTVFLARSKKGTEVVLKFALYTEGRTQRYLSVSDVNPSVIKASTQYQDNSDPTRRKAAMLFHEAEVVQDILDGYDEDISGFKCIANVFSHNQQTAKEEGVFYNVQEFGGTMLNTYMAETGVDRNFAYQFLAQGLSAVRLLQAKGYAHFDLKFDNFVVQTEGKDVAIKMIDFGGCTKFGNRVRVPTTGGYIPPELYYKTHPSSKDIDPKFDIYAIGIIFMLLLCPESIGKWNKTEKPVTDRNLESFVDFKKHSPSEIRLLRGLLRYDPYTRWSCKKAINFLLEMEF